MSSATVLPGEPLQRRWRRLALGWALLCALLTLLLLGMLPSARLSSSAPSTGSRKCVVSRLLIMLR